MQTEFRNQYKGRLIGIRQWEQLDELWRTLRESPTSEWHIYQVGQPPPQSPATMDQLSEFIDKLDQLLRTEHDEDYCGIVYADNPQAPAFIKIYDPNNLGMVCGSSKNPPLPGWILSKVPPEDLSSEIPQPQNRIRWWRRIFQ